MACNTLHHYNLSMKKQRVSIRDVAAAAGVSLGTASRALNRSGHVKEATVLAVNKAARELGYRPDSVAQSMRTRSTRTIGLLVSNIANPLYGHIIDALESTLRAAGYTLLLANTRNDAQYEKRLIDSYRQKRVDGLILTPCGEENPDFLAQLAQELPLVVIDKDIHEGCAGVHVDHYQGALQATRYLLGLGHRRIALMTPAISLRPGRERELGFRKAFEEFGVAPDERLIRSERTAMEFAFSEALSLLCAPQAPTAFLCLGTRILSGVLQALRHSGKHIPQQVSVIGIGDTDLSRLFMPSITTLNWDLESVGRCAAELLLRHIDQAQMPDPNRLVITNELLLRDSCGPALD